MSTSRALVTPGLREVSVPSGGIPSAPRLRRVQHVGLLLLFIALTFFVLFWRLGDATFWDPDEAHYAQASREMVTTGDWWAPYYNEQPFFDKPVLFYQLQGLSMLAFGPTEFAARLPAALAAFGLVLVTYWFGSTLLSRDTGLVASLLLLASPGVFALSRYAILDTVLTLFLFGGAALLAVAALENRRRLQWPGYAAIAVAVMVKGPLAIVLCGLTFILAICVSADLRHRLLALNWLAGLALVVVLSAPWFVYMYLRFRDAFLEGYLFDENIRLYAGRRFGNQPGFYFYFRILAAGLLPWTGLLLGRLIDDIRVLLRGDRLDALETLLWIWTATVVGFFTFSTFKLDHYVFPAAPALCLLCARAWCDTRAARLVPRHAGARIGLYIVGPIIVVVGLGCGYFLVAHLELSRYAVAVPVALVLAGVAVTILTNVRGGLPPRAPWIVLVALLLTYIGIVAFVMPAIERHKVVDDLARAIPARYGSDRRVATYRMDRWNPSFRFYAGRHVTFLNAPHEARAFFESPGPFYCLMRKPAFDEFVAAGVPLRIVEERDGMPVTSGRVLWRSRLRLARFVLVTQGTDATLSVAPPLEPKD